MGKQTFDRIRKIIAVLIAILFVVSLTAVSASAQRDGGWRGGDDWHGGGGWHDGGGWHGGWHGGWWHGGWWHGGWNRCGPWNNWCRWGWGW